MNRGYILPLCAFAGLILAVATITHDDAPEAKAAYSSVPVSSPFAASVAGAGIIEASTENISVGTPVGGIVTDIYARPGDMVKAGDPLFKLDDRDLQGLLLPAEAKVKEAETSLDKAKNLLDIAETVQKEGGAAISRQDYDNRKFDVAIAETAVASAQAAVDQLKIEIDRRTVRALVGGKVLQVKIRPGEYAQAGDIDPPPMLLGNDASLHVRVNVDENDAGRVKPGAAAVAFARGSPATKIPLKFERIEPYVLPKVSLTGVSTERVDTRVLQVIYSFDPGDMPVYAGEQMDVFIDAGAGKKS